MNKQEIFNAVVKQMREQGWHQSLDRNGSCVYRGTYNMKCAAGVLIKDEFYNAKLMENHGVRYFAVTDALKLSGIGPEYIDFVVECQRAHDILGAPLQNECNAMKDAFMALAKRHNLGWPEE